MAEEKKKNQIAKINASHEKAIKMFGANPTSCWRPSAPIGTPGNPAIGFDNSAIGKGRGTTSIPSAGSQLTPENPAIGFGSTPVGKERRTTSIPSTGSQFVDLTPYRYDGTPENPATAFDSSSFGKERGTTSIPSTGSQLVGLTSYPYDGTPENPATSFGSSTSFMNLLNGCDGCVIKETKIQGLEDENFKLRKENMRLSVKLQEWGKLEADVNVKNIILWQFYSV